MYKYSVYIDDGYVGFVHAMDLREVRSRAIDYYQIQGDQQAKVVKVED